MTTLDGTPIYGFDEGKLFRPASNAKLFTTAAAMTMLGPDARFTTTVLGRGKIEHGTLHGDLILRGGGDADFATGYSLPYLRPALRDKNAPQPAPLADIDELAAKVAAKGIKVIDGDIVGDDTLFEHNDRYPEGWGNDDPLWGYGAPVGALTVRDNQIDVTIAPNPAGKGAATLTFTPDLPYYLVNPRLPGSWTHTLQTQEWGREDLQTFNREPGSLDLFIEGDVKPGQSPVHEEIAIEDPAAYAAMALRAALISHGVQVRGTSRAHHRDQGQLLSFSAQVREPIDMLQIPRFAAAFFTPGKTECNAQRVDNGPEAPETLLAEHLSPPLIDDIVLTAKVSQNLHAEIMLRHISEFKDCGSSLGHSVQIVRQFLIHAGLDPDDFFFYDGSGLSAKDVITPRAAAQLLAYSASQPWFTQWKAALPVGGEDGTLASRFKDTPLKDHLFAKTGTLGETSALSGYLDAASGHTLIFSILVDDHYPGNSADRKTMDKILETIAATQ